MKTRTETLSIAINSGVELQKILIKEIEKGIKHFNNGNFTDALKYFSCALEIDQNNTIALSYTAFIAKEMGNMEDAINMWRRVVKYNFCNTSALIGIGAGYAEIGNLKKSDYYLHKVLHFSPNNAIALHNLGINMIRVGRLSEGKEYFIKSIKEDDIECKSTSFKYLGDIYRDCQEYDKAIENYKMGLEAGGELPECLLDIIECLDKSGKHNGIKDFLVNNIFPNLSRYTCFEFVFNIGCCIPTEEGLEEERLKCFMRAYELSPNDVDTKTYLEYSAIELEEAMGKEINVEALDILIKTYNLLCKTKEVKRCRKRKIKLINIGNVV